MSTYSIPEAGRKLGISADTVRRLIDSQDMPSIRVGRGHRIPVTTVEHVLHPPTEPPVVECVDGKVQCPYCGHTHTHGEGDGHRHPHCVARIAASEIGYVVRHV